MRFALNDLGVVPPEGWRWKCPAHGVRFREKFFPDLLKVVMGYLSANKMPLPVNPEAWLQNKLCVQNGWGPSTCRLVAGGDDDLVTRAYDDGAVIKGDRDGKKTVAKNRAGVLLPRLVGDEVGAFDKEPRRNTLRRNRKNGFRLIGAQG